MRLRPFLIFLAAIALVLLSTAAVGAVWISANSPIAQLEATRSLETPQEDSGEISDVAMFVSRQSPLVLSLLANPDRLEAADLLSVPASQRNQRRATWAKLQQSLLAETQFNYQRDIEPWLGDRAMLAITTPDVDRDRSNGAQIGYLFAFTLKDAALAQQSMQRFWQRHAKAKDRISETYQGVQITYKRAEKLAALTLASAVVGDRVVLIANSPKVLRDAINTVQVAGQDLSSSDAYQRAIAQLPKEALGFAFVNLPQFSAWLTNKPIGSSDRLYDSLLATLDADSAGLVANTLLLADPASPLPIAKPMLSAPSGALTLIPAASTVVVTGKNAQQSWAQIQTVLAGYEPIADWLQQPIAQLQQQIAVSLDALPEAVMSTINQDYAIAMLPRPDRVQPDWLFVARRSPETDVQLKQLDAIALEHGAITSSFPLETSLGTKEVYAWTKLSTRSSKSAGKSLVSLDTQVQGMNTTVGDYEIFATSLEAIAQATQASENSLLQNKGFQAAIAALKTPNDGYLYLADSAIRQVLNQTPLVDRQLPLSQFLDQVRSLSLTSYGSKAIGRPGAIRIQP